MLSGSVVRLCRSTAPPIAADEAALESQLARVDSARALSHNRTSKHAQSASAPRQQLDSSAGEALKVDLDKATEAEIEALPGIGPALAHRIVSFRDSAGQFGQIEAICEVSGIGPALAKRLRPLVTFTGPRRPLSDECGAASKSHRASSGLRGSRSR
ncbi:MAG TPA: helix-hairpin-helix domain-containing protein [Gemmatimonadaceae bacterium]|nr:helix-hairpin-helix domain-containing protein [Gemmatimonadaceae bacterium]